MTDYQLIGQYNPHLFEIPHFYQPGFFFNEPAHLEQQLTRPYYLLSALNQRSGRAEARCAFFINDRKAISPGAAPFGSIEFASSLPESVLDTFVRSLTEAAQTVGAATTLRLVNYPHCYAPEQASRLTTTLAEHGFRLIEANPTFFLPVTAELFEHNLVPAERRRLRKCRDGGFHVDQWSSPSVATVVDFIEQTRRQQGYPLTIYSDNLGRLLRRFPGQFLVFTVTDGPTLAALTVAVRVRRDILYSFLPASHPDYQTFSPMVMLTGGLYTYCQQQEIRILDLGTSLDNNQPKPSLMRFKRNLGAQESPKLVFEKSLCG